MFLRYFSLYRDTIAEISEGDAGYNIHGEKAFYVVLGNTYRNGYNVPPEFTDKGKKNILGRKNASRALSTCLMLRRCNLPVL